MQSRKRHANLENCWPSAGFAVCRRLVWRGDGGLSRGAKEGGGKTYGVTANFSSARPMRGWTRKCGWTPGTHGCLNWFRLADGLRYAKAEREPLVELAVVWEMLNKSVIAGKPIVVVGRFLAADSGPRARSGAGAAALRPKTGCGARRTAIWV